MPRAALALLCAALPGGIRAFAPSDCACAVVRPASGSLEGLCIAPLPPMEQEELDRICTCHAAPAVLVKSVDAAPIDCDEAADSLSRGSFADGMLQSTGEPAPDDVHAVAAAAQGAPPPVFCSNSTEAIQAWAANHSTPVADDPYVVPVSLQSSTTITLERSPMDTPFVCHKELGQGYLCHETRDAKLYPVVGAEGQFYVLCHPVSTLNDVDVNGLNADIPKEIGGMIGLDFLYLGGTKSSDSYCHALGEGSLVWTLAR